jgi:hypothetical protein
VEVTVAALKGLPPAPGSSMSCARKARACSIWNLRKGFRLVDVSKRSMAFRAASMVAFCLPFAASRKKAKLRFTRSFSAQYFGIGDQPLQIATYCLSDIKSIECPSGKKLNRMNRM